MKNIILFIFTLLLLISCNKVVEISNEYKDFKDIYKLTEVKSISFPLDSESQPLTFCTQYYKKENTDSTFFTFYNEHNNSIYFYDYKTQNIKRIIHLEKEGPNGVYPYNSGYFIWNMDSIFFSSMHTNKIFLLDSIGIKHDTYDLLNSSFSTIHPPVVSFSTFRPGYFINNKLYLSGYNHGEFFNEDSLSLPTAIIYDLKTKKSNYKLGYPESYRQGNWGEVYFRDMYWCYNELTNKFLLSFPNQHNLYISNLETNITKNGSSKFSNTIKSIDHPNTFPMPKEKRITHFLESDFYSSIVYDKYRNVYYRFAQHPWINYDRKIKPWKKPLSIVIFDADLNRIGEVLLNPKYSLSHKQFLITEDGLLLQEYNDNEDEIRFGIFKLEKNEI